MKKINKKALVIGTIVCVLPCLLGIAMWNDLPAQMPIHWNIAEKVDNTAPKVLAVFGLPALLAVINLVCHIAASADKRKKNYSKKLEVMTYWLIPMISVIVMPLSLFAGKGADVKISVIMPAFVFLLLIFIGNYLPKCKQNNTMGIKIPWTLKSEENWNRTHRMAGRLWVVGGIIGLIVTFAVGFWRSTVISAVILFAIIIISTLVPVIYSFVLHKKSV